MREEVRGEIAIISENNTSLSSYKELLEKHFRTSVFKNISDFWTSSEGRPPTTHVLIFDSKISAPPTYGKYSIPVYLLSDSDDLETLRKAYQSGVSEIRVKPVNGNEFITSLEKIVRQQISRAQVIHCNPATRKVWASEKVSDELTQRELQIFLAFQAAASNTLRRKELISQVWGKVQVGNKTLDVHLFNLRKKLSQAALEIRFSSPDIFTLSFVKDVRPTITHPSHSTPVSQ
jgi:FixJ family two-component response regulator